MLQVYTGNGKGKTTAAIGLAMRAVGAGFKVYIMQFMKGLAYSEQKVLKNIPNITLRTSGKPFFIAEEGMLDAKTRAALGDSVVIFPKGNPPKDYIDLIKKGLDDAKAAIKSKKYQLIILDELNVALSFALVAKEDVLSLLDSVPSDVEIVFTGRNAPAWLIDRADLVTAMQEVKHYYAKGIAARQGIED